MNQTSAAGPSTAPDNPAQNGKVNRPFLPGLGRRLRNRFVFALCAVLGLFLMLSVMTVTGGHVSGEQFCPELFQRRRFFYRRVPILRIQVTPVRHVDVTNDLETHLSSNRYIPFVTGGKPRWDLSTTYLVTRPGATWDAADLCAYLDQFDGNGDLKWLKWTEENPFLAHVLWPAIAEAAREGLYYFCPEMMRLAESATNPRVFQQQLDQLLAAKYVRLADARWQLDQPTSACRLYRLALIRVTDHAEARRGLATVQRAEAASHAGEDDISLEP